VLRHGEEDQTAGANCLSNAAQSCDIGSDVFENVKGSDHIERVSIWHVEHIHRFDPGGWHALGSEGKPFLEEIGARQAGGRKGLVDCTQHEPSAAAHLEIAGQVTRPVMLERPENELVAGAKPEAPLLRRRNALVKVRVIRSHRNHTWNV